MKCAFCQAENGPAAKFCSECGSPVGLQFCPKCETICEKAATVCSNCGYASLRTEDSAVGDQLPHRPAIARQLPEDHFSARESQAGNWQELLQSLEEEVHNQLHLQTRVAPDAPSRLAPAPRNPLPRKRIIQVHEAAVIEPTPSLWGAPGLWLVLTCAVGGCFIILSLPSPEIEQRALMLSAGKATSAPAVVAAAIPLERETTPVLGAPTSNPASSAAPPDATKTTAPEQQTLPVEATVSVTASNAALQPALKGDHQNDPARAFPLAKARLRSSDSQLPSTAAGRLASANRAAALRSPLQVSHLILTVSPWGEVYVDNKKWGLASPLRVLVLRPGKHSVRIRNADLPPYDETVKLQPDQTLRIKYKFK
jgi:ribosomal protein L40E